MPSGLIHSALSTFGAGGYLYVRYRRMACPQRPQPLSSHKNAMAAMERPSSCKVRGLLITILQIAGPLLQESLLQYVCIVFASRFDSKTWLSLSSISSIFWQAALWTLKDMLEGSHLSLWARIPCAPYFCHDMPLVPEASCKEMSFTTMSLFLHGRLANLAAFALSMSFLCFLQFLHVSALATNQWFGLIWGFTFNV